MNINGRTFRVKTAKPEYSFRKPDRHTNYNEDFLRVYKSCFRVQDGQTEGFFLYSALLNVFPANLKYLPPKRDATELTFVLICQSTDAKL